MGTKSLLFCMLFGAVLLISCSRKPTEPGPSANYQAPVFTKHPISQIIREGTAVAFEVCVAGDPAPDYQWQKNGVDIPGATASSYSIIAVQLWKDTGSYCAVASNLKGRAVSNPAALQVLQPPFILQQPEAQICRQGHAVSFTVSGEGYPIDYQWQKNGVTILGANAAVYTIASALPTDSGLYSVILSNSVGQVSSSEVVLLIYPDQDSVQFACLKPRSVWRYWYHDFVGDKYGDGDALNGVKTFTLVDSIFISDTSFMLHFIVRDSGASHYAFRVPIPYPPPPLPFDTTTSDSMTIISNRPSGSNFWPVLEHFCFPSASLEICTISDSALTGNHMSITYFGQQVLRQYVQRFGLYQRSEGWREIYGIESHDIKLIEYRPGD